MGEQAGGEQDLVLGHSILLLSDLAGHPRGSTCLWPETRKEERAMVMHDDSCFSPSPGTVKLIPPKEEAP